MKILIAEGHPLYRQGLCKLLKQVCQNIECIDATNYQELAQLIQQEGENLDLILLDLRIPREHGFEIIEQTRGQFPEVPIAVVTASESPADIRQVFRCGALGYIPKTLDTKVMLNALRLILSGGLYVPSMLLGEEPGSLTKATRKESKAAASVETQKVLTRRQRDVLRFLGKGRSNRQIARELGITEGTVKVHVSGVFRALGAKNRTEATLKFSELGLDTEDS